MYSVAVTAADYDNDGFEDLLVTGYGKVVLYHNDGNGHFTDVTEKAGIKVDGWAISSTWLDYDKDGCLDLFVGRYVKFDPTYRAFYAPTNYPGPLDYEGETNMLFHNNCDGTFTDVTEKSGIGAYVGRTMGVTAADFDNDGWDDIYVANDRTENFLFHNKHDGTFEEIANDTGTAYGQNGESTSSMGPVFADFEGRGLLDLWVTDGHYNRFLRNTGKLGFEDMGASNGISQANAQYVSWGTGIYDFDNDGQLDILVFHGGLIQLIPQEHTVFRGLGDGRFQDVSLDAGPVLSERTVARGACFADYENDGKVDAYVVNLGAKGTLLHNVSTGTGHWIEVKLVGTKSNRDGIGARVEVIGGRQAMDGRARGGLRLSFAGRRPLALRSGNGERDRQADRSLAQRRSADAGSAASRPRPHGSGAGREEAAMSRISSRVRVRLSRTAGLWAVAAALFCVVVWKAETVDAATAAGTETEMDYASPLELLFSPDGARIYVLCNESDEVRVLDAATYAPIKSIAVGHQPRGFSLSPDGTRLFVANSWDDTISVIDTRTLEVVAIWPVGAEPSGVVEGPEGKYVFVANRISSDVAVLDAQTGVEEKRLMAGRGASYLTLSPDGQRIYATHIYPNPPALRTGLENRTPPESEITVIDARRAEVVDRIPLHSIAGVFHLALSSDGRLGAVAEFHPKNLIPLAHLEHGGAFAYTLTLFGADVGKPVEIPLDELDRYASQPFDVVIAPDGSRLYVSLGGSESVLAIDVRRLLHFVHSRPRPASGSFASDLSASGNYVIARIPVGHNPRGLALSSDGRRLFVANRLDDTISVIDTKTIECCREPSLLKGRRRLARCAGASRRFIPHTIPSRGRSVAPVAISIPPSMGCSGIWSRTVSAATSWTTSCSRTSRTSRLTSGTAEIQTSPPSAARARKSTSGDRRTTTIGR